MTGFFEVWDSRSSPLRFGLRIVSASLSEINFCVEQLFQLRLDCRRINRGEIILHFLPHEHAVRADVNDAVLFEQTGNQFLDLRINQRFAAANADHRRVTFHRHCEAFFQRHHVLEIGGIFTDASAAGAGEIARVQRFELQDHGKLRRLAQFVFDDVTGDFLRQGKWKSHRIIGLERVVGTGRIPPPARWSPPGDRPSSAPAEKTRRAKPSAGVDAGAAGAEQRQKRQHCQPRANSNLISLAYYKSARCDGNF